MVPFALSLELAGFIPGAVFKTTTGCGHHIQLEQPDFVFAALQEFLK